MSFKELNLNKIEKINPFNLIGNDWMLITSGNQKNFNTMTASWGGLGILWNKKVAFSFVRPQRYTFEFMEENELFTLSFFDAEHKDALRLCGRKSGRDCDKVKEAGLTPFFEDNAPCFEEAKMILVCKKIYSQFINPECMIDKSLEKNYENKDYHKMFIGEILKCLVRD